MTAADGGRGTGLPDGSVPWLHDLGRGIARQLYRPAYRLRVEGMDRVPRTGPVVLIANHSTMIEPQLIFGLLPRRSVFLVKDEMFEGAAGPWLRRIGQVPVNRGAPDRTALTTATGVLRDGGLVGVFPEGTRGAGDVSSAHHGAAWLVRMSGAVVQPLAVRGTLRPPEDTRRRLRPVVDVVAGEPFALDVERGRSGLAEATERLRTALADLVASVDATRTSDREEKQ
ncbi:acyl-phosphate glycerol 3-phosphate acyltransferase [Saccharomonospora sp. CUA-673]|uniref:lysophospholipid acyltransferase family protein n=1 Tax=Saccharomonospora sp. CUA-673 TaxID=1904969 RepID=UPI0009618399|nr:lysophospholipid acyltransferase family protein [Saccharomonospora sp. CUA-673]OLT47555.1 acyl-phosphate glycerol 3-phosphate acyltransferase [Saccharomonospora sp. CUA-673]